MSIQSSSQSFNSPYLAQRYYKLGNKVIWGLPILAIPTLRLMNDPPETRWNLFTRDFSTYGIGAGVFFLFEHLGRKLTENKVLPRAKKNLYAVAAGSVANVLFAGLIAPKLYQQLEKTFGKLGIKKPDSTAQPRPSVHKDHRPIPAKVAPPIIRPSSRPFSYFSSNLTTASPASTLTHKQPSPPSSLASAQFKGQLTTGERAFGNTFSKTV